MTQYATERVLVVPAVALHALGHFEGFTPDVERYLPALLESPKLSFRPRAAMETDPGWKQLIPYVVLRWRDELFHYTRGGKGSESRLRALRSIGVGGHVNDGDGLAGAEALRRALVREVAEEVEIQDEPRITCIGLLNDDRNAVGQVHLGLVYHAELSAPRVRQREEALTRVGFAPLEQLKQQQGEFETWSQFVLAAL